MRWTSGVDSLLTLGGKKWLALMSTHQPPDLRCHTNLAPSTSTANLMYTTSIYQYFCRLLVVKVKFERST